MSERMLYPVLWTDQAGVRYLVDFEEKERADHLAICLAEAGRINVVVGEPESIDVDEAETARVKERVLAVIRGLPIDQASKALAG